jgi:hypothetical protein
MVLSFMTQLVRAVYEPILWKSEKENTAPIFSRQWVHQNTPQEAELAYPLQINSFQANPAGMLVMQ